MVEHMNVPNKFIGLVIGKGGKQLRQIERDSDTRICLQGQNENCGVFIIIGSSENSKKAKGLINEIIYNKEANTSKLDVKVDTKFVGYIIGTGGKNLHMIETKSCTKIRCTSKEDQVEDGFAIFTVTGPQENRARAEALIRDYIISRNEYTARDEIGGDTHFVSLNENDGTFLLKPDGIHGPKLDHFMRGERHRIEIEPTSENASQDFSETTISSVQDVLLKSLQHLHQVKDDKGLIMDLWCHVGRVFVHNVDEGEKKDGLRMCDITRRLNIINKNKDENGSESNHESKNDVYWKATFEEGIDLTDLNHDALPEDKDDPDKDEVFRHVQTRWRYDYAFTTPTARYIRFKLWEGLEEAEPPPEVKNLIKQVLLESQDKGVVAWLCYSSLSLVKGEIMTPSSTYDCRLKLRVGKRFVPPEADPADEENKIMCDYLSSCTFDYTGSHRHLRLPPNLPPGFHCIFYRSAKERIFTADGDNNETFTIITLDEEGFDSDTTEKREQKQLGIRVVLDSWSSALLSKKWEPDEIVSKLPKFLEFFAMFRNLLFEE